MSELLQLIVSKLVDDGWEASTVSDLAGERVCVELEDDYRVEFGRANAYWGGDVYEVGLPDIVTTMSTQVPVSSDDPERIAEAIEQVATVWLDSLDEEV